MPISQNYLLYICFGYYDLLLVGLHPFPLRLEPHEFVIWSHVMVHNIHDVCTLMAY